MVRRISRVMSASIGAFLTDPAVHLRKGLEAVLQWVHLARDARVTSPKISAIQIRTVRCADNILGSSIFLTYAAVGGT